MNLGEYISGKIGKKYLLVFIFLLVLLFIDPLIYDDTLPFIDSYIHAQKVEEGLEGGFSLTKPYYFGPVFHILVASISEITSLSTLISLRFFTLFMRISMVLVVYIISKNILDSKTAIISLVLASSLIEYIWPIPQSLATIFLAWAIFFIYKFEKTKYVPYLIFGYIFSILVCFSHLIVTIACFGIFFFYLIVKIFSNKTFLHILPILILCSGYLSVWETTEGDQWKDNINPRSSPPDHIAFFISIFCYLIIFIIFVFKEKFLPVVKKFIKYTQRYNPHKTSLKYLIPTYLIGIVLLLFGIYDIPAYPDFNRLAYVFMTSSASLIVIFSGSGISFLLREKNYFLSIWASSSNLLILASLLGAGEFGLLLVRSLFVSIISLSIVAAYYLSKLDFRFSLSVLSIIVFLSFFSIPHMNFEGVENQKFDSKEEEAAKFLSNLSEDEKIATDYRLHSIFRYYHSNVTIKPKIYFDLNLTELESIDYIVFSKSYSKYGVSKDIGGPIELVDSNLTNNWVSKYHFTLYYSNNYVEIWKL